MQNSKFLLDLVYVSSCASSETIGKTWEHFFTGNGAELAGSNWRVRLA